MAKTILSSKLVSTHDGKVVWHYCPGCDELHPIHINAPGAIGNNWDWNQDKLKPTFTPSVRVFSSVRGKGNDTQCHYFVRNGFIEYCSDSPHDLAGATVELPDIPLAHLTE